MKSMAIEMHNYRQNKKAQLTTRVKNTEPTLIEKYLDALVASGASITNFTLIEAQQGNTDFAPNGIYELDQRGNVIKAV